MGAMGPATCANCTWTARAPRCVGGFCAHERGGQGAELGNTRGGEEQDAIAVRWDAQGWRVTLEEDTGIRVTLIDTGVGPDEWLGAILLASGALAGDISALAGLWSRADPDPDLPERSGSVRPVE